MEPFIWLVLEFFLKLIFLVSDVVINIDTRKRERALLNSSQDTEQRPTLKEKDQDT